MEVVKRKTGISQEFLKVFIKCSTSISHMMVFIDDKHNQEIKSMEHLADTNFHRLPNGSMDIDYYVKKCHVERSLAAHNSIRKAALAAIRLMNVKRLVMLMVVAEERFELPTRGL